LKKFPESLSKTFPLQTYLKNLMSELQKFLFEGLPVRGVAVRLTAPWQEILARRANNASTGPYPAPVAKLLGEMTAAALLMQATIKFNGALVLQIFGDGPLKVAVVEVQPDLSVRSTATVVGNIEADATLPQMVNLNNQGRCAITLDPLDRMPGQQPYQGVVPLFDDAGKPLLGIASVLEHYMLQSEQLDTTLVLASNDQLAAGVLVQRLPVKGENNLEGSRYGQANEDEIGRNEDYNRIATFTASLKQEELLNLDVDTVLHRLFWEEKLQRFEPQVGDNAPYFKCNCSQERVSNMLRNLGRDEVEDILSEQGQVEVGCDFCGQQYRFDPIEAAQLFTDPLKTPSQPGSIH
jgi:molecular chaperone Hsp33